MEFSRNTRLDETDFPYEDEYAGELLEQEATLNAFDELSSKVPFFKYLSEELETKTFPEDSPPTSTKLLVNAINSVLHYLAEQRGKKQLDGVLSIDLPTKEKMVSLIEDQIVAEANWMEENHFILRAKTEFEQWVFWEPTLETLSDLNSSAGLVA